ncbi:hypothetical protein BLL52_3904 [Rhodoferax antarcticus ANT.BR]|uniref:Uncharacterized protein n=1 Tax=Rhodoferax antarcticus ANT.BR TaxID=1111071 RepID=A0A1Q8YAL2_9BURK|nr:hypothetical protein BLL52_3904 [Rhodoferax antarcticus ANT.BR]
MGRDDCAGVGLCSSAAWRVVCDEGAQIPGNSDFHLRENPFFRTVWGATLCPMRLKVLSVCCAQPCSSSPTAQCGPHRHHPTQAGWRRSHF